MLYYFTSPADFAPRVLDVLLTGQCESAMLKVALSVMKVRRDYPNYPNDVTNSTPLNALVCMISPVKP